MKFFKIWILTWNGTLLQKCLKKPTLLQECWSKTVEMKKTFLVIYIIYRYPSLIIIVLAALFIIQQFMLVALDTSLAVPSQILPTTSTTAETNSEVTESVQQILVVLILQQR